MATTFDTVLRVRQLADEHAIPLSRLVRDCGIHHSTLSAASSRGGQLQVDTIARICEVLHITLAEFFSAPADRAAEQAARSSTYSPGAQKPEQAEKRGTHDGT